MKLACPRCGRPIEAASINVTADLAQCTACNEVFKASDLLPDVSPPESLDPPAGSKITFRRENESDGVFEIPRRSPGAGGVVSIGFAIFWIAFVAFWTWGASHGGGLFAAFSIPFWLVGFGMLGWSVNSIAERQSLEIGTEALTIRKRRPFFPRRVVIPYGDVSSIAIEHALPVGPFAAGSGAWRVGRGSATPAFAIPVPTIFHGTQKTQFAEGVSEAEMNWLVGVLTAVVYKKVGKRL
jgi:hypothetical protein